MFARSFTFGGEKKCDPYPQGWLINQWRTESCTVDMTSSTVSLEYGVRVTEKFEIDYFRISDA